jgi:hypothetical protein
VEQDDICKRASTRKLPPRLFDQIKDLPLNDDVLLNQLEELAERLGITVRYENMNVEDSPGSGGLCRLKGEYVLIVHSRATLREKIRIVTRALRQFDFSGIYLKPVLRELLEESEESKPAGMA